MTTSVLAGQLFPPANIGENPNQPCPNNAVLRWTGSELQCDDPSTGVSLSCPEGQVMTAVTRGAPVCVSVTGTSAGCSSGFVQTGIQDGVPVCKRITDTIPAMTCPAGQVMTGISNNTPVCVKNTRPTIPSGTFVYCLFGENCYDQTSFSKIVNGTMCPEGYFPQASAGGSIYSMEGPKLYAYVSYRCVTTLHADSYKSQLNPVLTPAMYGKTKYRFPTTWFYYDASDGTYFGTPVN